MHKLRWRRFIIFGSSLLVKANPFLFGKIGIFVRSGFYHLVHAVLGPHIISVQTYHSVNWELKRRVA